MNTKQLESIARRLQRLRYTVTIKIGVRRATLKASGDGWARDGLPASYRLVLEFALTEGAWVPLGLTGADWKTARSHLVTESGSLRSTRPIIDVATANWAIEQLERRKPRPVATADLSVLS